LINLDIFKARLKRSGIKQAAGVHFVEHPEIDFQPYEEIQQQDFLMGLYKEAGCWTIVTTKDVQFCSDKNYYSLSYKETGDILHDFYFDEGKSTETKFISNADGVKMWVNNTQTANALQNILLYLERESKRADY